MILYQILIFLISIIFISLSIAGYGRIINLNLKRNFFLDIFLGVVIISFIITFLHFFLKINLLISFLIFTSGIFAFFYKKNISDLKIFQIRNIYFLIIISFFIPIFLSQKYHEDFGYYHLPYALSFIEEKIIFGFANIDKSYVYNSIWLNLYSVFFLSDKNFDFLTVPSFVLFLSFILFAIHQIILKHEKSASDNFLLIILFYFILKFTRISEFGVDIPAAIFCILSFYYFLKFSETDLFHEKREYFFLVLIFSIFSILIKFSTIPLVFLPVFLYLKYFKDLSLEIFRTRFLFIYILLIIFFIQQFIFTGCLLFPSNFSCLSVSWFNQDNINLTKQLELTNKGYFSLAKDIYTPEEYLKNLNWLSFWFKRNIIEISEHLLTAYLPIFLFLFFQKKKNEEKLILNNKVWIYLFLILSLLFWLNFSPVYRFAIHLFLILIFVLLNDSIASKNFSKKVFFIFLMTFIFYSFSKNIIRLNKLENIFLGTLKIENKYVLDEKNINQIVKIYRPDVESNSINGWQGRLCWDIPFICSYNKLEVKKKNGYLFINKLKN